MSNDEPSKSRGGSQQSYDEDDMDIFNPEYDGQVSQDDSGGKKWFVMGVFFIFAIMVFVFSPMIAFTVFGFETAVVVGITAYVAIVAADSIID